jgi:hypothetical protein
MTNLIKNFINIKLKAKQNLRIRNSELSQLSNYVVRSNTLFNINKRDSHFLNNTSANVVDRVTKLNFEKVDMVKNNNKSNGKELYSSITEDGEKIQRNWQDLFSNRICNSKTVDDGLELSKEKLISVFKFSSSAEILEGLLKLNVKEIGLLNFIEDEKNSNIHTFKYISDSLKYKIVIQINSRNNLSGDPHYKLIFCIFFYINRKDNWEFQERKFWGETHVSYRLSELESYEKLGDYNLNQIWENPGELVIRGVFKESYHKRGQRSLRLNSIVLLGNTNYLREWGHLLKKEPNTANFTINDGPFNFISEKDKENNVLPDIYLKQSEPRVAFLNRKATKGGAYFIFTSIVSHTKELSNLAILPALKEQKYFRGLRRANSYMDIINSRTLEIREDEVVAVGNSELKIEKSKKEAFLHGYGNDRYLGSILFIEFKDKQSIILYLNHFKASIVIWMPVGKEGRDKTIFNFMNQIFKPQFMSNTPIVSVSPKFKNALKFIVPSFKLTEAEPEWIDIVELLQRQTYNSKFLEQLSNNTNYNFESLN